MQPAAGAATRIRRSGSAAPARGAPCRSSGRYRRRLARLGHARTACARPTPRSTSSPPKPGAIRRPSCARARCRWTIWTPPAGTPRNGATPATAIWSAAGPARARRRSRRSCATCFPSSIREGQRSDEPHLPMPTSSVTRRSSPIPTRTYAFLREQGPVYREPHHGVVIVTGYEEARAIYSRRRNVLLVQLGDRTVPRTSCRRWPAAGSPTSAS